MSTIKPVVYIEFYWDSKYHWIARESGSDRVTDPEYWAKILKRTDVPDGLWYLGTTLADTYYGEANIAIELKFRDGMPKEARLVAPDGDVIQGPIKRFHILYELDA